MQNDSTEYIFLEQNNRRMEQTTTVCHWFTLVDVFKTPSGWNGKIWASLA